MKVFNSYNYPKNLPDSFSKSKGSNNDKLLQIEQLSIDGIKTDIVDMFNSLDLDKATGKTLDLYGEMYNQPRGQATDDQYRLMIKSKLMQNISAGDYKSVANALCSIFKCSPAEVLLNEVEGKSCAIELKTLPFDVINSAGLNILQIEAMVERLLPVGVKLEKFSFSGTFMFTDDDWIETSTGGFASNDGTIKGGYLGTIGYTDSDPDLPI